MLTSKVYITVSQWDRTRSCLKMVLYQGVVREHITSCGVAVRKEFSKRSVVLSWA